MKPASAMSLVSAMPGAAMLVFLSACSAAVMASPFFSQPVRAVAKNAAATITCAFIVVFIVVLRTSLMNVCLVVLERPFIIPIRDLIINRTLGLCADGSMKLTKRIHCGQ